MLCRLAAIGGAAFRRPTIGSVLGRSVVAPVFLRTASAALPVVSNLEQTSALTDLEKYLLLPQEPMNINVLEWWKLRDYDKCADPATGRPEGLPHLARMACEYLGPSRPRRRMWSASSQRRGACTMTSRAPWKMGPLSTRSLPLPTQIRHTGLLIGHIKTRSSHG